MLTEKILVWLLALQLSAILLAQPALKVEPESLDLGELSLDAARKHIPASFLLSNVGDSIMRLKKPRTSCGCTKAELGKHELQPGESTELQVEIDPTGRYARQRFMVFVNGNFPETTRRLEIKMLLPDTRTGWELMPPMLHVFDANPVPLKVRLFEPLEGTQITAVELPEGCELLSSLPLPLPAGGMAQLQLRCTRLPAGSDKRFAANHQSLPFTLRSNQPQLPQLQGWLNFRNHKNLPTAANAETETAVTETSQTAQIKPLLIEQAVLKQLLRAQQGVSDIKVLDLRDKEDFDNGHIPDSVSYPSTAWNLQNPPWSANAVLILIAEDEQRAISAAAELGKTPCRSILVLRGGYPAWR